MNTTMRHLITRTVFVLGVSALVGSCGCAPFAPPTDSGEPTSTTVVEQSTTTTAGGGSTTTTDPGETTTTDPYATTTTVDPDNTTTTTEPDNTTTTTTTTVPGDGGGEPGEVVDVDDLSPQDCATPASDDMFIDSFTLAACDEAHQMEVIDSFEIARDFYPDNAYPGNSRLLPDSYEACQPRFEDYVGVPFWDSVYDITTITPSPSTWADGDRTITCLLINTDDSPLNTLAYNTAR